MANADLRLLYQELQAGAPDSVQSLLTSRSYTSNQLNAALLHTVLNWSLPSHSQCLQLLLKAGSFLRTRDRYGRGVVLLAAGRGLAKVVEELVAKGCDVQEQDLAHRTALHWAVEAETDENAATTTTLLRLGTNWKLKDKHGNTALHIAAFKGNTDALKALIAAGCRPDVLNSNGDSPLHLAVRSSQDSCLVLLVQFGANPAALNKAQKTPMTEANARQVALFKQFSRREKPRWCRSHTAPTASLPDTEELEEESQETALMKERLAREEAQAKERTLRAELQQVRSLVQQTKEMLENERKVHVSSCLFLERKENQSLEDLFSHLGVDLMRFSVEVEAWQRCSEPYFLSLINTLRRDVKSLWTSADIQVFGSYSVALHLPRSSLDLMLINPPKDTFCLPSLSRYFSNCAYIQSVTQSNEGLFATLSVYINSVKVVISQSSPNHPGKETTKWVKDILQKQPMLRTVVLAVKHLFQWCETDGISAYVLFVITVAFLQQRTDLVDLAECFYELVRYYAWEFTCEAPISILTSDLYLLPNPHPGLLSIQDPILPSRDLGEFTSFSTLSVGFK